MEAVNRGAQDAGGRSVGCNIRLPSEQSPNRYLDRWAECEQFFIRKVLLCRYSYAFIALPGGFGTMDELFEVLTLIQTEKIERFPVVLIGSAYWEPVVRFLQQMVAEGMADSCDLGLALVTDDLDEAMHHIRRCTAERFGLALTPAATAAADGRIPCSADLHPSTALGVALSEVEGQVRPSRQV
jgi:uncharacterized protein (TIGR00730 family)